MSQLADPILVDAGVIGRSGRTTLGGSGEP